MQEEKIALDYLRKAQEEEVEKNKMLYNSKKREIIEDIELKQKLKL